MALYTQHDIDELIGCPKKIDSAPRKELKLVGADWRNDMILAASDGTKGDFSVFMRKSEDFPENFSIGLVYHAIDGRGEITLLRCNGQHGVYNGGGGDSSHPHWDYHIHRASESALDAGERAEKYATKTIEYATFDEALQYFVVAVNLNEKDRNKYFQRKNQPWLFN
jgi:hypothetical protein